MVGGANSAARRPSISAIRQALSPSWCAAIRWKRACRSTSSTRSAPPAPSWCGWATRVVGGGGPGRLDHIILEGTGGVQETLATSAVFVLIGAHPRTDWLPAAISRDEHGFVLVGADAAASGSWPLERPPLQLETSMPGVFAVGDVRQRIREARRVGGRGRSGRGATGAPVPGCAVSAPRRRPIQSRRTRSFGSGEAVSGAGKATMNGRPAWLIARSSPVTARRFDRPDGAGVGDPGIRPLTGGAAS